MSKGKDTKTSAGRQPGPVWSLNEWDPLEEIIVGSGLGARYPHADVSTRNAEFAGIELQEIPRGPFPDVVIEETEEDLTKLVGVLEGLGVTVRRPAPWDHDQTVSNQLWQAKGFYNYCPRDLLLVVGDRVIETPNAIRGRYHEAFSYRHLLLDYMDGGARWISAPKPLLRDSSFDVPKSRPVPRNDEPIFDAANVLRFGTDLVYMLGATGNECGARWLQSVLGDHFRVHTCEIDYYGSHIDTSIVALRPGLLLCNPERVQKEMLPHFLRDWDVLFSPPPNLPYGRDARDAEYVRGCIGSKWMGMNLLSVGPDLVIVDAHQHELIDLLERRGLNTIRAELRHARMLGGGFHCVTLDIRRRHGPAV